MNRFDLEVRQILIDDLKEQSDRLTSTAIRIKEIYGENSATPRIINFVLELSSLIDEIEKEILNNIESFK